MRIEFLDPECTTAIVTRGWFRPKWARVARLATSGHLAGHATPDGEWHFTATNRRVAEVDSIIEHALNAAARKAARKRDDDRDWLDTGKFPRARLVERKS